MKRENLLTSLQLPEQLKVRGSLEAVGGLEYLTNLASLVPTTANAKHYAKIVEEKSILEGLSRLPMK